MIHRKCSIRNSRRRIRGGGIEILCIFLGSSSFSVLLDSLSICLFSFSKLCRNISSCHNFGEYFVDSQFYEEMGLDTVSFISSIGNDIGNIENNIGNGNGRIIQKDH